jgi:hypothetical protein
MPVCLVTHIPDKLVIGGIIYIMECNSQFHHPKAGSKMPAVYAYHINDILAQFVANLVQFFTG